MTRAAAWRAAAMFAVVALALHAAPVAAQGSTARAVPTEIDGQINGKRARFVAEGSDVVLTTAEADRIGVPYRDAKIVKIGTASLWLVTLDSITVDKRTRLLAPAGVVASISAYFTALRAHPIEAMARSRQFTAEVNGKPVEAFDLGIGGIMISVAEASRVGLDYRAGKRQVRGKVEWWLVETPVKTKPGIEPFPFLVVTEPEAFLAMTQAQLDSETRAAMRKKPTRRAEHE